MLGPLDQAIPDTWALEYRILWPKIPDNVCVYFQNNRGTLSPNKDFETIT